MIEFIRTIVPGVWEDVFGNKGTEGKGYLRTALTNADGDEVTVQNPLPTDGDSVYVKDIDVANSDNGNFSGSVTDYFDSLKSVNTDSTANNPKSIRLWFYRTVYAHSIGFGCDDLTKGFGASITVKLLGSGEAVRFAKTFSPSDPNSFLAEFGPKAFNGIQLDFNTADEVCLSNLTVQKSQEVNASITGLDPNGDVQDVSVTIDGYLDVNDTSSGLSIAEGQVTGKSFVHKFGNAPDFNTSSGEITVWDGAEDGEPYEQMNYVYSTTADIDSISAQDASDTQDINIQGLDGDYNLTTQTVTLNGQTRVAIPTPLLRVFRVFNDNATDFNNHVFVFVNTPLSGGVPIDTTKIRAVVHPENNQTEMAVYTIPAGKTGYMRSWYASTAGSNKSSNYVIKLKSRNIGKVFRLKHKSAIEDGGTSYIQHEYTEPEVFAEKTDIEMTAQVTATGATGASVSAGFDIVLVDN